MDTADTRDAQWRQRRRWHDSRNTPSSFHIHRGRPEISGTTVGATTERRSNRIWRRGAEPCAYPCEARVRRRRRASRASKQARERPRVPGVPLTSPSISAKRTTHVARYGIYIHRRSPVFSRLIRESSLSFSLTPLLSHSYSTPLPLSQTRTRLPLRMYRMVEAGSVHMLAIKKVSSTLDQHATRRRSQVTTMGNG